ncbi:uncharacterized protein BT62DRAFT_1076408 [Guyanagaster necrorhizus]|uniref:Uncharacterized protein n=1 Tax=Guyanagaster necrorhizus TaxID=856835 RepID=A0A9P7VSQ4_9AGAR|nr:uncharacterized protein BT62DRAFT_1076408 [Guyanagaster necrorhizus MCA 3950]KAG7446005.1 hypothetical protein BT62DRAFT_1076408 [Guyanagaster necrorhizus MCA 3950]
MRLVSLSTTSTTPSPHPPTDHTFDFRLPLSSLDILLVPTSEFLSLRILASLTTDADIGQGDIPVSLRDSFTRRRCDFPIQDVEPDFVRLAMFDEQFSRAYGYHRYVERRGHCYISTFEQVIPLCSVGYINPLTRKFVVLFNAIDPAASTGIGNSQHSLHSLKSA